MKKLRLEETRMNRTILELKRQYETTNRELTKLRGLLEQISQDNPDYFHILPADQGASMLMKESSKILALTEYLKDE